MDRQNQLPEYVRIARTDAGPDEEALLHSFYRRRRNVTEDQNDGEAQVVSYLRVSTARQGTSGLGLEAPRAAVAGFLNGGDWTLVQEVLEVESGKRNDRPALATALKLCRKHRATLVIAKLDRLARNVAFISNLMKSGVEFVAVDMPQANRFVVHILAAVAEQEAEAISKRTKAALAAAKARGTKLGGRRVSAERLQRSELRRGKCVAREQAKRAGSSFQPSQRYEPPAQARFARSRQNSTLARSLRLEDAGIGLRSRFKG